MKPTELYLLRHGIAEDPKGKSADADRQRHLTAEGKKKITRVAKGMVKASLSFDLILTSPYPRTLETAEIVARQSSLKNKLKVTPALAPGGNPKELLDELKHDHARCRRILLVGHEPFLSQLISLLISGGTHASAKLRKGGLVKLSVTNLRYGRCARLEWLLTPAEAAKLS